MSLDHTGMLMADKAKLEARIDRKLPETLFDIEPWGSYIYIVRAPTRTETDSGIIIPSMAQDPPAAGWILAIGPTVGLDDTFAHIDREYLPGTRVVFGKWVGYALHIEAPGIERAMTDFDSDFIMLQNADQIWCNWGRPPEVPIIDPKRSQPA